MNNSIWDNTVERQDFVKYTGVTDLKVDLVNPTKEQKAAYLGMDIEKATDPNYDGKIVFYLSNDKVKVPLTFWLEDDELVSKDGTKKCFINYEGKTCWGADPNRLPEWFDTTGMRVAKKGEEDLYAFILNWTYIDVRQNPNFRLPFEDICNGDLSSLQAAIERFADRKVKAIVGIRNEKYMEVYNRTFGHENLTVFTRFKNALENEYFKLEVNGLDFGPFTPMEAPDSLETEMDISTISNNETDLPF